MAQEPLLRHQKTVYFIESRKCWYLLFELLSTIHELYQCHNHDTVEQCSITMENKLFNKSVSISMQNFLDFLKLAGHVHESISNRDVDDNDNQIDYNALAGHDLVNELINSKSSHSPKLDISDENNDKNGN